MKKMMMLMVALMATMCLNAQTAIETPKLTDNMYVSVGGQVSTPMDLNGVFPLNSAVSVSLGKELSPIFGVNVEGAFWFGSHIYKNTRFDRQDAHNTFRGSYVGLNSTTNLTHLFIGERKFEIQTVVGIGWAHAFYAHQSDRSHDDLGCKTGLNFDINLNNGHSIYIQPAVLWNLTKPASHHDRVAFNRKGAQLSLALGYKFHFKNSNKTHTFKYWNVGQMNDEINRLQAELDKKPRVIKEVTKEIIKEPVVKVISLNNVIFFAQNSFELSDTAKEELNKIPENTEIKTVAGYASVEGTPEYNLELSKKRAENVARFLSNRNVKVNNVVGLGVQGETSNRVVILVY